MGLGYVRMYAPFPLELFFAFSPLPLFILSPSYNGEVNSQGIAYVWYVLPHMDSQKHASWPRCMLFHQKKTGGMENLGMRLGYVCMLSSP